MEFVTSPTYKKTGQSPQEAGLLVKRQGVVGSFGKAVDRPSTCTLFHSIF